MPGLVKVGRTTRTPEERAAELSSTTGIPTAFLVADAFLFEDCDVAERLVHGKLWHRRVTTGREFFRATPEEVSAVIYEISGGSAGTAVNRQELVRISSGSKETTSSRTTPSALGTLLRILVMAGLVAVPSLILFFVMGLLVTDRHTEERMVECRKYTIKREAEELETQMCTAIPREELPFVGTQLRAIDDCAKPDDSFFVRRHLNQAKAEAQESFKNLFPSYYSTEDKCSWVRSYLARFDSRNYERRSCGGWRDPPCRR